MLAEYTLNEYVLEYNPSFIPSPEMSEFGIGNIVQIVPVMSLGDDTPSGGTVISSEAQTDNISTIIATTGVPYRYGEVNALPNRSLVITANHMDQVSGNALSDMRAYVRATGSFDDYTDIETEATARADADIIHGTSPFIAPVSSLTAFSRQVLAWINAESTPSPTVMVELTNILPPTDVIVDSVATVFADIPLMNNDIYHNYNVVTVKNDSPVVMYDGKPRLWYAPDCCVYP